MINIRVLFCLVVSLFTFSEVAICGDLIETQLNYIRPIIPNNLVYIGASSSNNICNTDMFVIDLSKPNGKAAYAAALTAVVAKNTVVIELTGTGCAQVPALGIELNSLFLRN